MPCQQKSQETLDYLQTTAILYRNINSPDDHHITLNDDLNVVSN